MLPLLAITYGLCLSPVYTAIKNTPPISTSLPTWQLLTCNTMKQTYDKTEFYRAHLARDPGLTAGFLSPSKPPGFIAGQPALPERRN